MRVFFFIACGLLLLGQPRAQDPKYTEFVRKLTQVLEYNDTKGLDRLVRKDPDLVVRHFAVECWEWKGKQDEARRQVLDALKAAWQRTFRSATLDRYERYILAQTEKTRMDLYKVDSAFSKLLRALEEAERTRRREDFEMCRDSAMRLAQAAEQLGHPLFAARYWALVAVILNKMPDATLQDRQDAVYALERFVEHRKTWEYTEDIHYKQNVNWLKSEKARLEELRKLARKRKEAGYEEGVKGADALVIPGAPEEIGKLEFFVQSKPPQDMFVRGGNVPSLWLATRIEGTGPAQMSWFRAADVYLVRPGMMKFGVTTNGMESDLKKNPYQPIEVSMRYEPSEFFVDADRTRRYAMWFYVGSESENVFELTPNLAPQKDSAVVYYKSAAAWRTTIRGETVTFFDDNGNGKLFDDPMKVGVEMSTFGDPNARVAVPCHDSMQIGKGPRRPLSQFVKIGDEWLYLRPKGDDAVGARPLNPEFFKTGFVQFVWKGPAKAKPRFLIVRGRGEFSTGMFDVISKKPVEVPAGEYEISYGRCTSGHGARTLEAHVFAGDSRRFTVGEGKTVKLQLGAPFRLDFVRAGDEREVVIDSLTFRILGASGELYARINGATPTPEVLAAKNDKGRGAKRIGEFIRMNMDQYYKLSQHPTLRSEIGYYPVVKGVQEGSTVFRGKLPFKGAFVGLRQRKHRLFGKIEPIWKQ